MLFPQSHNGCNFTDGIHFNETNMIPKMSLSSPGNVKKGRFKLYGKLNDSILHFRNFSSWGKHTLYYWTEGVVVD